MDARPNYEGPRCEWCSDPNQFYDDTTAVCTDCPHDLVAYALPRVGGLLAVIILLALLRFALLTSPRLLARVSKTLALFVIKASRFGVKTKCAAPVERAYPLTC